MQLSQQKAKEEAKELKVLSGKDYFRRFRKLPNKAPGPDGWTVSLVVLMAKKPQIERPIALCHVVYKAWIKARYYLVVAMAGRVCRQSSLGRCCQGHCLPGCQYRAGPAI